MSPDDLLYPRSKFQVLRALHNSSTPICLHEIAERADLVVGSVQTSLDWLLKRRIVSKQRLSNRTYFRLSNKTVKDVLSKLLAVLEPIELQDRSRQYQHRAMRLLSDIDDANSMIEKARGSMKR